MGDTVTVSCGPVTSRRRRETMPSIRGDNKAPAVWPIRNRRSAEDDHVITISFEVTVTWEGGTTAADLEENDQVLLDITDKLKSDVASGSEALSLGTISPAAVTVDRYAMMKCPPGQTASYIGTTGNCGKHLKVHSFA